jgi:hypothetical protein
MVMTLTYEEMLAELLGLIGQEVVVVIDMRFDRQRRPLASFHGVLKGGELSGLTFGGTPIGYPPGEAILLRVGQGFFVMRKDDFKHGRREEEDVLGFEVGRARIVIGH